MGNKIGQEVKKMLKKQVPSSGSDVKLKTFFVLQLIRGLDDQSALASIALINPSLSHPQYNSIQVQCDYSGSRTERTEQKRATTK